jgi:hypothetical protein
MAGALPRPPRAGIVRLRVENMAIVERSLSLLAPEMILYSTD